MSKHTEWHVVKQANGEWTIQNYDHTGIAQSYCESRIDKAELIVKAVNNHQPLLNVLKATKEALQHAQTALDDWTNTYAPELCDEERVKESLERISKTGTLAYIATVNAIISKALELTELEGEE